MKSEEQMASNWFKLNVFNGFSLMDFVFCFLYVFFVHIFLAKKIVLINLTEREFAVNSVIRIYTKMCELLVHPAYDLALF